MTNIYTKFINFVRLDIKKRPSIFIVKTKPTSDNYVFAKVGIYYTWENANQDGERVESVHPFILKSILMKIISKALSNKGFEISTKKENGKIAGYFVYHDNDRFLHSSEDIFRLIKGFEYRIRIDNNVFYFIIDYKTKFIATASYSQLMQKGIAPEFLINRYVIFSENTKRSKGKVIAIDSGVCKIKDLCGKDCTINLDFVYPETKPHNLNIILQLLGRRDNAVIIQRKATFLDIKQASKRRLGVIKEILDNLQNKIFPIEYEGFRVECQKELTPIFDIEWDDIKNDFDSRGTLLQPEDKFFYGDSINQEPQLLFDKEESSKFHLQPAYGLKLYGPFSKREVPEISISIITPPTQREAMQNLVGSLRNGDGRYFLGMKKCFRCDLDLNRIIDLKDESMESYNIACAEYFQKASTNPDDVILVYVPEAYRDWIYSQYYLVKHILLNEGYPSQMIIEKTLKNPSFALLNLASAIYAKAGGIPWVLQQERREVDMILGLSYSQLIPEMAVQRDDVEGLNRCVAFVNVFDQYGQWMFFQGNAYPYSSQNLPNALKEVVKYAVSRFESEKGCKPKRISLHFSQKFSKDTKAVVIQALKELIDKPQVAFISITDCHPFRVFDLATSDGSFSRRSYVYLDKGQYLLSTTGISDIARQGIGTPKLLNIVVQEYPQRFLEPNEVVGQILAMTRLNWASANPLIKEPVTVSFSREIAYLVATMNRGMWERLRQPAISRRLEGRTWFI